MNIEAINRQARDHIEQINQRIPFAERD